MTYNPQVRDWRPRLTGQGNYGPLRLPRVFGPMHLWNHVAAPPAQNTLVVMKDGSVVEGNFLSYEDMYGPLVHRVFVGGYDHRCDPDDQFSFDALTAAGYPCKFVTEDIYDGPDDHYSSPDVYVKKETP